MIALTPTEIVGVYLVEARPHEDARGGFARLYCQETFEAAGVGGFRPVQTNLSRNTALHTLRGMHHQAAPHAEAKLVQVLAGEIYDVALDLRPESPTYRRWTAARLSAERLNGLFIPEGCAHGFLTLTPGAEILYQMGAAYAPGAGRGVRWDDPAFGIDWPAPPAVISERDAAYENVDPDI